MSEIATNYTYIEAKRITTDWAPTTCAYATTDDRKRPC